MSSGGVDMSVEIALFQNYILAHDQTMRGHLFQRRQDAADMLVRVYEDDNDWQLAPGIHEMARLYLLPAEKSGHGMKRNGGVYVLLAKVVENLHVQGTMMPLVGFVEINGDLDCHSVWHFTVPSPVSCRLT